MCGRFCLTSSVEALRHLFGFQESPNLPPRYNIAPTTPISAIRLSLRDGNSTPEYFSAHWGLVPSWSKSADFSAKMINARSETVTEKPSFRAAYKARRCLIPANGFFEWQKLGKTAKQPWLIGLKETPLIAFAGLWENWKDADGQNLESCTILTTTATDSIAFIHHRMPVILEPENFVGWMSGQEGASLLKPYASDQVNFHKVSARVGNIRNDDTELLESINAPEQAQQELF